MVRAGNVVIQNIFDKLPVGIDNGAADTACDIGRDHVPHERALAGARRTEDDHVLAPGLGRDHEFALVKERAGIVLRADRGRVQGAWG
jgi:hypothetical protein